MIGVLYAGFVASRPRHTRPTIKVTIDGKEISAIDGAYHCSINKPIVICLPDWLVEPGCLMAVTEDEIKNGEPTFSDIHENIVKISSPKAKTTRYEFLDSEGKTTTLVFSFGSPSKAHPSG